MDELRPPPDDLAVPIIRPAEPGDVETLHRFIVELAEAERGAARASRRADRTARVRSSRVVGVAHQRAGAALLRRLRARALDEIEIMRLDGEVLHDVAANIVPAR